MEKIKANISIAKLGLDFYHKKLKLLKKMEEKLFVYELNLDYKESMKKYYSSEALKQIIYKINAVQIEIRGAYFQLVQAIERKDEEAIKSCEQQIKTLEKDLFDLVEKKIILAKHFSIE